MQFKGIHLLLISLLLSASNQAHSTEELKSMLTLTNIIRTANEIESLEEAVKQLHHSHDDQLLAQNEIQETLKRIEEHIAKNDLNNNKVKENLIEKILAQQKDQPKPKENSVDVINNIFDKLKEEEKKLLEIVNKTENCIEASPTPIECESPFVPVGKTCLHFYTAVKNDYPSSRELCKSLGGDMVIFQNHGKFRSTMEYFRKNLINSDSPSLWIGAYRDHDDDIWKWIDGTEMSLSLKIWQQGEPNNADYIEDKACMYSNTGFMLNDLSGERLCGVVCEKEGTTVGEVKIGEVVVNLEKELPSRTSDDADNVLPTNDYSVEEVNNTDIYY